MSKLKKFLSPLLAGTILSAPIATTEAHAWSWNDLKEKSVTAIRKASSVPLNMSYALKEGTYSFAAKSSSLARNLVGSALDYAYQHPYQTAAFTSGLILAGAGTGFYLMYPALASQAMGSVPAMASHAFATGTEQLFSLFETLPSSGDISSSLLSSAQTGLESSKMVGNYMASTMVQLWHHPYVRDFSPVNLGAISGTISSLVRMELPKISHLFLTGMGARTLTQTARDMYQKSSGQSNKSYKSIAWNLMKASVFKGGFKYLFNLP